MKRETSSINLKIFTVLDVNIKVIILNIITSIRLMVTYK